MRLHIQPQWYPCYDGSQPLTWAVYDGDLFLCYSWSFMGAYQMMQYLTERNNDES